MKNRLILLILLLPFLAEAQNLPKLRVAPQWTPQSQFAGIYIAVEKGFYREAGVDVEIVHPSPSNSSINKLLRGEADIITSQMIQALLNRDSGIPLVNILQTSIHNSLVIVTREPVNKFSDLNGKKIGRWKSGFFELAVAISYEEGVNITWIPFMSNISLFVSGAIDGTLAMLYNEYVQILMSGFEIGAKQLIKMSDLGYDIPEDGFYVNEDFYESNKESLGKFVEATKKGWNWAREEENREEALDIVMSYVKKENIATNKVNQRWMLNSVLELQQNEDGKADFILTREAFEKGRDLMILNQFIMEEISYEDFYKTFK